MKSLKITRFIGGLPAGPRGRQRTNSKAALDGLKFLRRLQHQPAAFMLKGPY